MADDATAAIIGDAASVRTRVGALADAGVDEFVGIVFDRDEQVRDRTRALLRELDGQ